MFNINREMRIVLILNKKIWGGVFACCGIVQSQYRLGDHQRYEEEDIQLDIFVSSANADDSGAMALEIKISILRKLNVPALTMITIWLLDTHYGVLPGNS